MIALSASDTCPRAGVAQGGRWDVAPVFPAEAGERLPASMKRLCAYSWVGCGARDAAALPLAELVVAADDPPVVQALGAAEKAQADAVTAARSRLVHAVDALVPLPSVASATPVFVGIADTSPAAPVGADDIPVNTVSHGFDVAWIARYLACPNGSLRPCLAHVRTDLALGRAGGRGARADLAASIVRLVRAWKSKEGRKAPLVIPIAAGWEPLAERAVPFRKGPAGASAANDTVDSDVLPSPEPIAGTPLSPGGRAVLAALEYASCHGALILAAAGGDPGYKETPSGAMLPAAWETLHAPSPAACKAWFGDDAVLKLATPTASYAPLVHAIGGVDERDHPIFGTRDKSLPRIVVPAAIAAAYPEDPADAGYARLCAPGADVTKAFVCSRTTPRTGTSMAVAAASAIAAVVWAHHPTWSGHDVMSALYTGGTPLGEKADLSLDGPGKNGIVRATLCGALAASCRGAPKGTCPERLSCGKLPAFAKGPHPSPFVPVRPGLLPLAVTLSGAPADAGFVCPGCLFHLGQVQKAGCELAGVIPAALFQTAHVARLRKPSLDLYDALGNRLGFVEGPGFMPQEWSAEEAGDRPVYASAASCNKAAQVVLRWGACVDSACNEIFPMARELPIVP